MFMNIIMRRLDFGHTREFWIRTPRIRTPLKSSVILSFAILRRENIVSLFLGSHLQMSKFSACQLWRIINAAHMNRPLFIHFRDRPFNFWGGGGGGGWFTAGREFFSGIVICKIFFPIRSPCTIFFATLSFAAFFFNSLCYLDSLIIVSVEFSTFMHWF
jgi:hypothetical protein